MSVVGYNFFIYQRIVRRVHNIIAEESILLWYTLYKSYDAILIVMFQVFISHMRMQNIDITTMLRTASSGCDSNKKARFRHRRVCSPDFDKSLRESPTKIIRRWKAARLKARARVSC